MDMVHKQKGSQKYDPFEVILKRSFELNTQNESALSDAIRESVKEFEAHKIKLLLEENNPQVQIDGLMILSELGEKGCSLIDSALKHAKHNDWQARFYLANSLLVCNAELTIEQISHALVLCDDEDIDVRCKMFEILACLNPANLRLSISRITSTAKRHAHNRGVELLNLDMSFLKKIVTSIDASDIIGRCYAGGAILKLARKYPCQITIESTSEERDYLTWQLDRICKKYNRDSLI